MGTMGYGVVDAELTFFASLYHAVNLNPEQVLK
jgi:hypothetical protein